MLKIINWFCGASLAVGLAAAAVFSLRRYLLSSIPQPEQDLAAAFLDYPTATVVLILPFLAGVLVLANYFQRDDSSADSELGTLLALSAMAYSMAGGFVFGRVPASIANVVALCVVPLLAPLALIAALAALLYLRRYLPQRGSRWIESSTAAAWPWLALAFLVGPGLWGYAFVVVGHGWSPGWSFLLLAAFVGALRVGVPIVVGLLFWPILTEQQMDP